LQINRSIPLRDAVHDLTAKYTEFQAYVARVVPTVSQVEVSRQYIYALPDALSQRVIRDPLYLQTPTLLTAQQLAHDLAPEFDRIALNSNRRSVSGQQRTLSSSSSHTPTKRNRQGDSVSDNRRKFSSSEKAYCMPRRLCFNCKQQMHTGRDELCDRPYVELTDAQKQQSGNVRG
jgi:hypothetical protein